MKQSDIEKVKDIVESLLGRGNDDALLTAYALDDDPEYGEDAIKDAQESAVFETLVIYDKMLEVDPSATLEEAVRQQTGRCNPIVGCTKGKWYI